MDKPDWDFFVSYAQADWRWAEWIAWQLEESGGFQVLFQAWDMVPGTNLVVGMQNGVIRAQRMIAVVSDEYTHAQFGTAEWHSAFSADPSGFTRKLLAVRVEDCARPGLLGQVVPVDLFDKAEDDARAELVRWARLAVSGGRAKPASAPIFPGLFTDGPPPPFPGAASKVSLEQAAEPAGNEEDSDGDVGAPTGGEPPDRASTDRTPAGEVPTAGASTAGASTAGAPPGGVTVSAGRDIYGPGQTTGPTTYNFGARPADNST
ncbi:TIR domain-containing protein [Frankia sp. AgPm24]|uniref:toll/interleukin-1 receptor domain-containing protein n=1 Tax=Frankia sp. AgPm24 TaxID=631128 RepID=UPI0020105493|nr:toll/interleukin-1 receptor domain-containing protein [Frankia sp. AgPm24]MCK9923151.1 TIR domain-containing protein [Frankia sp. AgPm24]